MTCIASTAVTDELDCLGIDLGANESFLTVKLQDGALRVFDKTGKYLHTCEEKEEDIKDLKRNISVLVGNKLVTGIRDTDVLKVRDAGNG